MNEFTIEGPVQSTSENELAVSDYDIISRAVSVRGDAVTALLQQMRNRNTLYKKQILAQGSLRWEKSEFNHETYYLHARKIIFSNVILPTLTDILKSNVKPAPQVPLADLLAGSPKYTKRTPDLTGRNRDGYRTELVYHLGCLRGKLHANVLGFEFADLWGCWTVRLKTPDNPDSLTIQLRERPPAIGTCRVWNLRTAMLHGTNPGDTDIWVPTFIQDPS